MLSFHIKFVQTDRWTGRWTTVKLYTPNLSMQGHKNGRFGGICVSQTHLVFKL